MKKRVEKKNEKLLKKLEKQFKEHIGVLGAEETAVELDDHVAVLEGNEDRKLW